MTHDDFHNQMSVFLAGGLTDPERAAFMAHAGSCPACAAALEQAEAADRELDELFAAARPGDGLEDRVIARLRTVRRPPMLLHPMVRRAAVGVAATILLGGVGFAVTQAGQGGSALFSLLEPESNRVKAQSNLRAESRSSHELFDGGLPDVATPDQMARRLAEEVRAGGADAAGAGSGQESRIRRIQQEVAHRFETAAATAEKRIATGRPENLGAARVALDQARLARASNATAFPQETLEGWDARIRDNELSLAEVERRAVDLESEAASEITSAISEQERSAIAAREQTLGDLERTSRRLTAEARYGEALGVVDQILTLDPKNDYASGIRPLVEVEAQKQPQEVSSAGAESLAKQNGRADHWRYYKTNVESDAGDAVIAGKPVDVQLGYVQAGVAGAAEGQVRFDPASLYARTPDFGDRFGVELNGTAGSHWGKAGRSTGEDGTDPAAAGAGQVGQAIEERRLKRSQSGNGVTWDEGRGKDDKAKLSEVPAEGADQKGKVPAGGGEANRDGDDFFSPMETAQFNDGPSFALAAKDAGDTAEGKQDPKALKGAELSNSGKVDGEAKPGLRAGLEVAVAGGQQPGQGGQGQPPATEEEPAPVDPPAPAQEAADAVNEQAGRQADENRQAQQLKHARQIIRNGEMAFEVDGYDSAVVQITKIAAEEDGYVATTESEKLPNGKVKGSVVLRVPPERLDTLVLKLRGLGDLKSSRISAQDVTKQFTDLAAQLRAAQTMEKRLLEIIEGGKGEVKDLLEAEKQLGTWRERIERLQGEIKYYENLISLSTLTVTLVERDIRQSALLSETEQVSMGIEATDVEKARAEALEAIDEAKGRIVESDLKTHDAGQFSATIIAEVAPDAAAPLIDRLKQVGRVSRLEVQRRRDTPEGAPPAPGARLERKDTWLQISIYNLANVAPRNTTSVNLAAEDVEKAYRAIIEQVTSEGGRVVNSQLTKPTPEQTTGTIVFEAPSDVADVLLGGVRTAGEVMRLDSTTNPDTQNTTDAKRGFSVQIQSLATVPPRESTTLRVAARDVSAAFNTLRETVAGAGGRILTSQLTEQDGGGANVTGQLDFEIRRDDYAAVEAALSDAGVVLSRNVARSADAQNTVDSKVLFQVAFVDERIVEPREKVTLSLAVDDVATQYEALLDALREMGGADGGGGARVLVSRISLEDPNETTATVEFDVRREDRAAVDKLLADAGAIYGRTVARPAEGQPALDEKVRLTVTLNDVDNLKPRETTTLGLEVTADVTGAVKTIEATAIALGGRQVDSDWARDSSGRNIARVVVDVPLGKTAELLDRAQREGPVTTIQREQDPSAPQGPFSRGRLAVTIATTEPIVQSDQGIAESIKSGLSTSVHWLLRSVTWIVVGVCLIAPWAIILWLIWRVVRRNRERRRHDLSGPTPPPPGGPAASPAA